jgi:uncharacterized protein (TIGR00369 family)
MCGLAATLLDSCMGCAVHTMLPLGRAYTTLEIKVHYVRALKAETGRVRAIGTVVHIGGLVATAEGRVLDAAGKLYAHGTTTCLHRDGRQRRVEGDRRCRLERGAPRPRAEARRARSPFVHAPWSRFRLQSGLAFRLRSCDGLATQCVRPAGPPTVRRPRPGVRKVRSQAGPQASKAQSDAPRAGEARFALRGCPRAGRLPSPAGRRQGRVRLYDVAIFVPDPRR